MINEKEPLTLYALNNLVRCALNEAMPSQYWVIGELSEVRETTVGHCYFELVQRDEKSGSIVAKARGTIWSRTYRMLRPYFIEETGQQFAAGIKVLLQVTVDFHEAYGFALDVCDIEPSFTIGEAARRRRQILDRLTNEGVIDLNKELPFPQLPQRIAVISSSTAAGYGDFCDHLHNNPYGFVFYPHLFAAPMQGDKVEEGIISVLDKIAGNIDFWDVVVIIRGGGATSDLACFDTYDLANNCAQFPLPIITGIGHQRDDTVLDSVSHTRVKTPTAAADLLIQAVAQQASAIDTLANGISAGVNNEVVRQKLILKSDIQNLPATTTLLFQKQRSRIDSLVSTMLPATALLMQKHQHRLDLLMQQVENFSPQRILSLGYSLTTRNGRVVRSADELKAGETVITQLSNGKFESIVK